jgi:hypothetical protein
MQQPEVNGIPKGQSPFGRRRRSRRRLALACLLVLACAAAWAVPGYLRFVNEYQGFLALVRSLPETGVTVEDSRYSLDRFDALMAGDTRTPLDILYLNDSTMGTGAQSTAELLSQATGRGVSGLSGAGYTPTVYAPIFEELVRRRGAPRLVVFQINPRSFSNCAPFHGIYYEHFRRYLALLRRSPLADHLACLRAGNSSAASFYGHRYSRPGQAHAAFFTNWEAGRDFGLEELAKSRGEPIGPLAADYYSAYCRPVEPGHPMLAATAAFIGQIRAAGSGVIVYVTPVNTAQGERLLGEVFTRALAANLAVIREAMSRTGAVYADYSGLLGEERFNDPGYANEHTDLRGREILAGKLAGQVAALKPGG